MIAGLPDPTPTPDILRLIAELEEFKGRWQALGRLAPDRLTGLRRVATIESIGSSTRIKGAKLTDAEIDHLLGALAQKVEVEHRLDDLPPLAASLLQLARDRGRFTLRDAVTATSGNRNTIKVHLRRLVQEGRLRQAGRGRGTWYVPG